jgi:hypothetical protein
VSEAAGAKARALLRLIHEETGGEEFTAAELLQYCVPQNLALEAAVEDCIAGRKRVNRSLKRRASVAVNVRTLGQYLQTIAGRRYRFLRLEKHYRSERWRYEVVNRRPMGKKQRAKLFAVPRIEVKPTRSGLAKLSEGLEREEKQRAKACWNFEVLKAHAAQEAATPRDRYGRVIKPKPVAAAPAPAPRPDPPKPVRCKFGGELISGRYADGRQKCCGRRHD